MKSLQVHMYWSSSNKNSSTYRPWNTLSIAISSFEISFLQEASVILRLIVDDNFSFGTHPDYVSWYTEAD